MIQITHLRGQQRKEQADGCKGREYLVTIIPAEKRKFLYSSRLAQRRRMARYLPEPYQGAGIRSAKEREQARIAQFPIWSQETDDIPAFLIAEQDKLNDAIEALRGIKTRP